MPKLRAITADERAHKRLSVIDAADHGTHPDLLRAESPYSRYDPRPGRAPPRHRRPLKAITRGLQRTEATAKAGTEEDSIGLAAATADEPWQGV
jgi:hypothetical protein